MAQTATRRPGRPRELPIPVKLAVRFKPELYRRMDAYLATPAGQGDTQRAVVERGVELELDRLTEGGNDEHHDGRAAD